MGVTFNVQVDAPVGFHDEKVTAAAMMRPDSEERLVQECVQVWLMGWAEGVLISGGGAKDDRCAETGKLGVCWSSIDCEIKRRNYLKLQE